MLLFGALSSVSLGFLFSLANIRRVFAGSVAKPEIFFSSVLVFGQIVPIG
jgi:hypothetical protein